MDMSVPIKSITFWFRSFFCVFFVGDYGASAIVQSLLHHPTLHPLSLLTYRPIFVLHLNFQRHYQSIFWFNKGLSLSCISPYFSSTPDFSTQGVCDTKYLSCSLSYGFQDLVVNETLVCNNNGIQGALKWFHVNYLRSQTILNAIWGCHAGTVA